MATDDNDLPAIVATNVERWGAEDDGWRGYHREGDRIVPDERVAHAVELALPRPGAVYGDIGCANGVITRLVADKIGAGRVVGMDFVDAGVGPGIEFHKANLDGKEPLPFADATFDVITCLETLEHLHDTDRMMAEIRRILRPDGYAIVAVPRLDGLISVLMLAAGLQPPAVECSLRRRYGSPDASARVSGHVSHFTRRALLELVEACGFSVDAVREASIYGA